MAAGGNFDSTTPIFCQRIVSVKTVDSTKFKLRNTIYSRSNSQNAERYRGVYGLS